MYKKLLTSIIVLGLVSVATAVDDFDSYADQSALEASWTDASTNDQGDPGTSSATVTLLQGGYPTVAEGGAAMHVDFVIPGGWDNPGDPTDLTMSDRARIQLELANPIDVASYGPGFELSFYIRPTTDVAALGDLNIFLENADGAFGRVILPCPIDEHFQWWYPPEWVPACLGDVEQFDDWVANAAWNPPTAEYVAKDFIGVGEWGKVTINLETQLQWDWGNILIQDLGTIDKFILECNVDLADYTAEPRLQEDLTELYPIVGGVYGFDVDDIGIIPEPATIALLGLGGLALLRVRRKH